MYWITIRIPYSHMYCIFRDDDDDEEEEKEDTFTYP